VSPVNDAARALDGFGEEPTMLEQEARITVTEGKRRRPFDVGEEEGDRSLL
jgi:hypothetical protein